MNKKSLLSILSVLVLFTSVGVSGAYANTEKEVVPIKDVPCVEKQVLPDCNCDCPHHRHFHKKMHPKKGCPVNVEKKWKYSPEEMQAKKLEFEKRLNLTEEQKAHIEKNRKKDHEKVKPLFEQLKTKHEKIKEVRSDDSLSKDKKIKKIKKLKKEIREIKSKLDNYRKQNMENFEKILTEEQKVEFAKIKAEQKEKMKKFKRKRMPHFQHRPMPLPLEQ